MDNPTMTCRACGRDLVIRDRRNYETLAEHVTDPNREPLPKDGWGCPKTTCKDATLRYLKYGEGPYDVTPFLAAPEVRDEQDSG